MKMNCYFINISVILLIPKSITNELYTESTMTIQNYIYIVQLTQCKEFIDIHGHLQPYFLHGLLYPMYRYREMGLEFLPSSIFNSAYINMQD